MRALDMQLEIQDVARGWVKIGLPFEYPALMWVIKGCDLLVNHANAICRIRNDDGKVLMHTENGTWKKPTGGPWRASAWADVPGFEDTIGRNR